MKKPGPIPVAISMLLPGNTVVGASGAIGIMVVQFLKTFGCHVPAVCNGKNEEFVRRYGAEDVIDYTKQNVAESDRCLDAVLDIIGGRDNERACLQGLRSKGCFVTVAGPRQHIGEEKLARGSQNTQSKPFWIP